MARDMPLPDVNKRARKTNNPSSLSAKERKLLIEVI
jgi:hypothetical protein